MFINRNIFIHDLLFRRLSSPVLNPGLINALTGVFFSRLLAGVGVALAACSLQAREWYEPLKVGNEMWDPLVLGAPHNTAASDWGKSGTT